MSNFRSILTLPLSMKGRKGCGIRLGTLRTWVNAGLRPPWAPQSRLGRHGGRAWSSTRYSSICDGSIREEARGELPGGCGAKGR